MTMRFKSPNGFIKTISPEAFSRLFDMHYASKLSRPRHLPANFIDRCKNFGRKAASNIAKRRLESYRHQIAASHIAPTYIAKVNAVVGYGLYAYRDIQSDEMIGEYTGVLSRDWIRVVKKAEDINPYLLKYPFDSPYAIDSKDRGNAIRFINHSSKNNNVRREYILLGGILHIIFVSTRPIQQHGQIFLDYGNGYWRGREPVDIEP